MLSALCGILEVVCESEAGQNIGNIGSVHRFVEGGAFDVPKVIVGSNSCVSRWCVGCVALRREGLKPLLLCALGGFNARTFCVFLFILRLKFAVEQGSFNSIGDLIVFE